MEMNRLLRTNGYVFVIDWKYEDINSGPPLEHRLPMQKVINDFLANGFNLLQLGSLRTILLPEFSKNK